VQDDGDRYDYLKNPEGSERHAALIINQKEETEAQDIYLVKENFG